MTYRISPSDSPDSVDRVKVLVTAYDRESVLATQRGDPDVILRDRVAREFQFAADVC